jgi:peptidoglycan hydrolase-like protein with peptidoglycan-binding domain
MKSLVLHLSLLAPFAAVAANALTSLHPEQAYPDDAPALASPGEHAALFQQVQEKLRAHGFDAGPVNGDFGAKTQAALAQFQRARDLPVSGSLDDKTRAELGVD